MNDTFQVRDSRTGFTWVNNEVIDHLLTDIDASSFLVYAVLARHANNESQIAFPSQITIASLTGLSERTVRTSLAKLRDENLITWDQVPGAEKKYKHNVYTLLKPTANFAADNPNHRKSTTQTTGSPLPLNNTKSIKTQTPGFDFADAVERIRLMHPRSDAPVADRKAIKTAVTKLMENRKASQRDACALLFRTAKLYASVRAQENPTYTKTCAAWFNGGCYEKTLDMPLVNQQIPSSPDGLQALKAKRAAKRGR